METTILATLCFGVKECDMGVAIISIVKCFLRSRITICIKCGSATVYFIRNRKCIPCAYPVYPYSENQ